ncbi:MAG: DUF4112 domain-containing protein [Proteobacteria bacterium]|nr:DUF4112 domain-containing protein [Pseudomonadota bacterium]
MTAMSNNDPFSRNPTRPRGSSARAKVIDQDGREIHPGPQGADAFGTGAFGREPFQRGSFQQGSFAFDFSTAFRPLTREQRLARLEALAKLLDVAFIVPGTSIRYGIDGLIGLVPVIGDIITTAISLWLVREARALGAPWHITARMLGNVALDGVIGVVPVVGDAFDVMFRANIRNVRMLRRWIDKQSR